MMKIEKKEEKPEKLNKTPNFAANL